MASQQWRRRWLPDSNPERYTNRHGNGDYHTTSDGYTDGHRNDHTTSVSYANGDGDRFTHNKAYTDAKATANAASAALSRKRMG
jgi:hypothetical protein